MQGTHQSWHEESEMRCSLKKMQANLAGQKWSKTTRECSGKFPERNAGVLMEWKECHTLHMGKEERAACADRDPSNVCTSARLQENALPSAQRNMEVTAVEVKAPKLRRKSAPAPVTLGCVS